MVAQTGFPETDRLVAIIGVYAKGFEGRTTASSRVPFMLKRLTSHSHKACGFVNPAPQLSPKGAPMIPRYTRKEMAQIWEPQTRFRIWFEIEAHATDALAELGVVPKEAAAKIWEKGKDAIFDVARIDEIEAVTKHDVIAFLTHLSEIVGPEARFVHQGMTSSDVLDTCFNVQLTRAADLLIADVDGLLAALKRRAFEHKDTVCIGRSHGIHAEPTTFGIKLAQAHAEFQRAPRAPGDGARRKSPPAPSPAPSAPSPISIPRVEEYVAAKLGLDA